jgi:putative RNase toxin 21 of polymorphic toxin system
VPLILSRRLLRATDLANYLGYDKRVKDAPFNSHGQPVLTNGKSYITPDADAHKGGVWKMVDRKGNRIGTYDARLTNRIAQ